MLRGVILLFLACAATAQASEFDASVTHITDGDTLWVQIAPGRKARQLRLQGIDAPELCQPGGAQAREALHRQLQGQHVRVRTRGRDSYGRTVAQVHLRDEDIGAWMVRQGHAWSPTHGRQAGAYAMQERAARAEHLGLWRQPQPMQPRVFRRFHGSCHAQPAS